MAVAERLVAGNRAVRAFADAVGEPVGDEAAREDWRDHAAQRVVNDPVAERRGRHDARLRVAHLDGLVAAGAPCTRLQFALQSQQFALEIGEERRRPGLAPFATHRPQRCLAQRVEARDTAEEVVMPARHGSP